MQLFPKNDFEENAPTPDDSDEGLPSPRLVLKEDPDPSARPWFQVPDSDPSPRKEMEKQEGSGRT